MTLLSDLAEMIAFWEETGPFRLVEAYPYQTHIPLQIAGISFWFCR